MDEREISRVIREVKNRLLRDEKKEELSEGNNFLSKKSISLSQAKALSEAVEREASRIGVKPVVAVSDSAGNIILLHATDDSYIASYDVALSKAYTVVALKMSTKTLKALAQPGESLYGIQFTAKDKKIAIFGGGDVLKYEGLIVGGLGVSGGSEEQDTYLSAFGAKYFEEEML